MYFVLFLVVSVTAQSEFCQFFCNCGFRNVTCRGTPQFPSFENPFFIQALTIRDSEFSHIPNLDQFGSLRDLGFFNTPNINCESIQDVQSLGIRVHTDIICLQLTTESDLVTTFEPIVHPWQFSTNNIWTYELSADFDADSTTFTVQTVYDVTTTQPQEISSLALAKSAFSLSITAIVILSVSICIFLILVFIVLLKLYKRSRYRRNIVRNLQLENENFMLESRV